MYKSPHSEKCFTVPRHPDTRIRVRSTQKSAVRRSAPWRRCGMLSLSTWQKLQGVLPAQLMVRMVFSPMFRVSNCRQLCWFHEVS